MQYLFISSLKQKLFKKKVSLFLVLSLFLLNYSFYFLCLLCQRLCSIVSIFELLMGRSHVSWTCGLTGVALGHLVVSQLSHWGLLRFMCESLFPWSS